MQTLTSLTLEEWEERFKPQTNHINTDAGWTDGVNGGILFETYGAEHEHVCSVNLQRKVWTWVNGDNGTYLVNGFAFVNRIGHFVCEVPYPDDEFFEIAVEKY